MTLRVCARVAPAGLVAILLATVPVMAAQPDNERDGQSVERMAREGVEQLMNALGAFLQAIPQYGVPYVEEDGDIVIPRLNKPDDGGGDPPRGGDDGADSHETEI